MNKLKVLIAADTYYPKVDGVLIFIDEFIKRAEDDFQIHLVVPQFSSQAKHNGIKTTFLPLSKRITGFTYPTMAWNWANLQKIKQAVQEADVVFIQELAPVGMAALHYATKYNKQKILYVHNTPWDFIGKYYSLHQKVNMLIRKVFVHYYNKADLLLIPYHDFEKQLREVGVKTKAEVARLGVDIERFSPTKQKESEKIKLGLPAKPVIGFVGRISYEKNVLVLLEAFKKLHPGSATLLIVGDGNEELVQKCREVRDCLVTGFVKNVEQYLRAMDIFVLPSLTETTSLATLEAMASGIAVITTKVGFLKEYIVKNYNGLFFPRNSPAMLAAKLELLLQDAALRQKLGQNARKTIAYSFSWERSINRIKRLINSSGDGNI